MVQKKPSIQTTHIVLAMGSSVCHDPDLDLTERSD